MGYRANSDVGEALWRDNDSFFISEDDLTSYIDLNIVNLSKQLLPHVSRHLRPISSTIRR